MQLIKRKIKCNSKHDEKHIALFNDFHKSAILYSFQIKTFKPDKSNELTYSCAYDKNEIIISEIELYKLSNLLNSVSCKQITLLRKKDGWLHIKKYYNNLF